LKKYFGKKGLAVFVKVPGIDVLEKRLRSRQSENEASIAKRLERVKYEMTFEDKFDITLLNDNLEEALKRAELLVEQFINKKS
jgi:guanylate kinase